MLRWRAAEIRLVEVPCIDAFLEEIDAVCKKHKMSISHEDKGGAFMIVGYNVNDASWLKAASDDREAPEVP